MNTTLVTEPDPVVRALTSMVVMMAVLGGSPPCTAQVGAGWIDQAPMPRPRLFHIAGAVPDGRILVAAGKVEKEGKRGEVFYGDGQLSLDIYDPDSDSWTQGPPAPKYGWIDKNLEDDWAAESAALIERYVKNRLSKMELTVEHPMGGTGTDGRFYWFSRLGPIHFVPTSGIWAQADPIRWNRRDGIIDPSSSNWDRDAAATVTGPDGKFYVVGGRGHPLLKQMKIADPVRVLGHLETYDPATRDWKRRAPMKQARQLAAAAFGADDRLYVFGGFAAVGFRHQEEGESDREFASRSARERKLARTSLRSVEAYDPATDTWEDRAPMPAVRQSMGAALGADGRIYVVGGADQYTNPAPKAEVFIYDPTTNTWSEGPPLNHPRYHHAVVATPDGRIWAIGGTNGTNRRGALPRGEPEGLVRPIETLDTRPARARPLSAPDAAPN